MKTPSRFYIVFYFATFLNLPFVRESDADTPGKIEEHSSSSLHLLQGAKLNPTPGGFIPNVGQVPNESVKFALRDSGVTAYFTDRGFVVRNGQTTLALRDGHALEIPVAPRWELVDAKPVEPVGDQALGHTVSFFRGNDRSKWHANVPAYGELTYPEIQKGLRMRVESREGGFEYSFYLKPHAEPNLRFRYYGISALEKSLTGDLIVHTPKGHFTEKAPVAFQWIDGARHDVESRFELISENEYRIALGTYDQAHELVIDPVLDWSTFLGGDYVERFWDVAVDGNGNVIVGGDSYSSDFPDNAGFSSGPGVKYEPSVDRWHEDAIVAKFTPDGTQLLWAGYLAGNGPTGETLGRKGLVLNSVGDIYVAGLTDSPDFPTTDGSAHSGLSDAFVAKISSGGLLLWSTLLGGSDEDNSVAIEVDHAVPENVYLAGLTRSANFPTIVPFDGTLNGAQDIFLTRFDGASGAIQWSSYLGGSNEERPAALAVDASGALCLFGDTGSPDFFTAGAYDTTLGGTSDAFVAKLGANGTGLSWCTFLGGSGKEHDLIPIGPPNSLNSLLRIHTGRGDMTLDSAGNILVAGQTYSADFPTTPGALDRSFNGNNDGYVAKISTDGKSLLWASYLGGTGPGGPDGREEIAWGIAVNPWDEVFVAGFTYSINFPVTSGALKTSLSNNARHDGFLTKLSANGSTLLYSTYVGGNENNDAVLGLAYDDLGNVVVTGWAQASSFPITSGTYQPNCVSCAVAAMGYASDGFVVKFLDAYIAHDGFESANYTGGSGVWVGGWTASGDIVNQTQDGPHSGKRHIRLRRNTGYLRRTVNIAGAASVRLGFWARINSFEGSDRADVKVSTNGSSWTTLRSFLAAQSDNKYHYYELAIPSSMLGAQLQIAFDAEMNGTDDNWFIDDVRVMGLD